MVNVLFTLGGPVRYPVIMSALLIVSLAAASAAPLAPRPAIEASGYATVTILRPAIVGRDLPAPAEGMAPRAIEVALPGGGRQAVLVYEFE